jgi:hypothetical protein
MQKGKAVIGDPATIGKIILWREPTEAELRMLDSLAAQISWRSPDGYLLLLQAPEIPPPRETPKRSPNSASRL